MLCKITLNMDMVRSMLDSLLGPSEPEMEIGLPVDVWRPIHVEVTDQGLVGLPKDFQVL